MLRASYSAKVSEAFQGSEDRDGSTIRVSLGKKVTRNRGRRALGFCLEGWRERNDFSWTGLNGRGQRGNKERERERRSIRVY